MKPELLNELIDAGFPFKEPTIPSLEELIEACGHVRLDAFTDGGKSYANCCDKKDHEQTGATPTEAVARLWLALKTEVIRGNDEV